MNKETSKKFWCLQQRKSWFRCRELSYIVQTQIKSTKGEKKNVPSLIPLGVLSLIRYF